MKHQLNKIRWYIYKVGLRPKAGSIWYSPSLAWLFGARDAWEKYDAVKGNK